MNIQHRADWAGPDAAEHPARPIEAIVSSPFARDQDENRVYQFMASCQKNKHWLLSAAILKESF
jgi:hypothetical protein